MPPEMGTAQAADGVTYLTCYLVLLMALPSRLVVGPLGGAGAPAALVAAAGCAWWTLSRLSGWERASFLPNVPSHPVRNAALVFVGAVLASYVAATTRAATSTELNSTEAALILLTGWMGLLLIAGNGIPSRERLDTLLRRLSLAIGLVAALGVVQFIVGSALIDQLQIPGLTVNNGAAGLAPRDGFNRVIGTAIHPIEFGVVLSAALPICIHYAIHSNGNVVRRWFPVAAIAIAVPLSISRSAMIAVIVALLMVAPTWTSQMRRGALVVIVGVCGTIFVLVPGMLGTLSNMFSGLSEDSSALSRTASYDLAGQFISRSPWVGRGFLTFLPQYRTLDNQFLGVLIDTGVIGLLALLGLFMTGIVTGFRCRRASSDVVTRSLASSLVASIAASAVTFAFFDAFSFAMISGLTFLVLGCTEALWRIERAKQLPVGTVESARPPVRMVRVGVRNWYLLLVGVVITVSVAFVVRSWDGTYSSTVEIVLYAPTSVYQQNPVNGTGDDAIRLASVVQRDISGGPDYARVNSAGLTLANQGVIQGDSITLRNSGSQWANDFNRPILDIQAVDTTRDGVTAQVDSLVAEVQSTLQKLQDDAGVDQANRVTAVLSPADVDVTHDTGRPSRALAAVVALGFALTIGAVVLAERLRRRSFARRGWPAAERRRGRASEPRRSPALGRHHRTPG